MNRRQELDEKIQKDIENFLNKKPTKYITDIYFKIKNEELYNDFYYKTKEVPSYPYPTNYTMVLANVPRKHTEQINLFENYDNIHDLINKEKDNIEYIAVISSKGE